MAPETTHVASKNKHKITDANHKSSKKIVCIVFVQIIINESQYIAVACAAEGAGVQVYEDAREENVDRKPQLARYASASDCEW